MTRLIRRAILFAWVVTVPLCAAVLAFADIYVARDDDAPNVIQAHAHAAYVSNDAPAKTGESGQDSGGTDDAGAAAGINDQEAQSIVTAQAAISPYLAASMSVGGALYMTFVTQDENGLNHGDTEASVGQTYNGVISSDTKPIGTPCTVSGSISFSWGGSAGEGILTRNVSFSVGDASVSFDGSTVTITVGMSMDSFGVDPASGSVDIPFSYSSAIGADINIGFDVESAWDGAGIDPGLNVQDVFNFSLTADVSLN